MRVEENWRLVQGLRENMRGKLVKLGVFVSHVEVRRGLAMGGEERVLMTVAQARQGSWISVGGW